MDVTCDRGVLFNALLGAPDVGVVTLEALGSHLQISDTGTWYVRMPAGVTKHGVFRVEVKSLRECLRTLHGLSLVFQSDGDFLQVNDSFAEFSLVAAPVLIAADREPAAAARPPTPIAGGGTQSETPLPGSGSRQTNRVADHSGPSSVTSRSTASWAYDWASVVARIAIVASVLSVIGGVAAGVVLSKFTTVVGSFGAAHTAHHGDVLTYWIVAGVLSAALWMALAIGLELLADIGKSLRVIRSTGT